MPQGQGRSAPYGCLQQRTQARDDPLGVLTGIPRNRHGSREVGQSLPAIVAQGGKLSPRASATAWEARRDWFDAAAPFFAQAPPANAPLSVLDQVVQDLKATILAYGSAP
jgi:hypothetical protein